MFSLSTQCPAGPPGELCVNDDAVCAAVWFNLQTATNECGLPCLSTPIASLPRASPSSALWSSRRARSRFAALSSPTANAALAAATCCPSLLAPLKMSFFSSPFAAASTAASSAASLYARTESERGRESALEWYRAHARARYGSAEGESRIAIPDWDACLFVDVMCELTDMREFEAHDLFDVLDADGCGTVSFERVYALIAYLAAYQDAQLCKYLSKFGDHWFDWLATTCGSSSLAANAQASLPLPRFDGRLHAPKRQYHLPRHTHHDASDTSLLAFLLPAACIDVDLVAAARDVCARWLPAPTLASTAVVAASKSPDAPAAATAASSVTAAQRVALALAQIRSAHSSLVSDDDGGGSEGGTDIVAPKARAPVAPLPPIGAASVHGGNSIATLPRASFLSVPPPPLSSLPLPPPPPLTHQPPAAALPAPTAHVHLPPLRATHLTPIAGGGLTTLTTSPPPMRALPPLAASTSSASSLLHGAPPAASLAAGAPLVRRHSLQMSSSALAPVSSMSAASVQFVSPAHAVTSASAPRAAPVLNSWTVPVSLADSGSDVPADQALPQHATASAAVSTAVRTHTLVALLRVLGVADGQARRALARVQQAHTALDPHCVWSCAQFKAVLGAVFGEWDAWLRAETRVELVDRRSSQTCSLI